MGQKQAKRKYNGPVVVEHVHDGLQPCPGNTLTHCFSSYATFTFSIYIRHKYYIKLNVFQRFHICSLSVLPISVFYIDSY